MTYDGKMNVHGYLLKHSTENVFKVFQSQLQTRRSLERTMIPDSSTPVRHKVQGSEQARIKK